MPKIFSLFIIVFINKIIFSQTLCSVGENNCSKCNPLTKLCVKCDKDVYTLKMEDVKIQRNVF